ncbi:hypothetical protein HPHPH21_0729 [Helicobacter pylori Hp H-21]|nr:hypothetical protein HPHPH21_0729 [Helicobacter pylori Hp H-21]
MHESLKNEKILRKTEAIGTLPNHYRSDTNYSTSNLYKIARVSHRVSLWLNYKG